MKEHFIHQTAAVFAVAVMMGACGGTDPDPTATIVEITPDIIEPADDTADDLTIVIAYSDGDADLGGGVVNVHDCRASGLVTVLTIPPIASEEALDKGVPIEGELELAINDIGDVAVAAEPPQACIDLGITQVAADEAIFCVTLVDAAGNSGAGDCSGPISVVSDASLAAQPLRIDLIGR